MTTPLIRSIMKAVIGVGFDPTEVQWFDVSDVFSGDRAVNLKYLETHRPPFTQAYTAPQPAKPAERVPLTDDEIDALELPPSGTATVRDLVRLIEAAHGIK